MGYRGERSAYRQQTFETAGDQGAELQCAKEPEGVGHMQDCVGQSRRCARVLPLHVRCVSATGFWSRLHDRSELRPRVTHNGGRVQRGNDGRDQVPLQPRAAWL